MNSNIVSNNTDENLDLYFRISLSVQVSTSASGLLVNSLLFYALANATNWPYGQRLLFLNVIFAAALSTAIHTCQGSYQLYQHAKTGLGWLQDLGLYWYDMVGDSSQTAVAIGMVMLAFQNLFALRQCSRNLGSRKPTDNEKKKQTAILGAMIAATWIAAFGIVNLGLNPQAQVKDEEGMANMFTYFSFALGLLMEMSVAGTIWATLSTLRRLGVDFEIRRAHQSLAVRVKIKKTMSVTTVISRVLIIHVTTWMVSLGLGFGLNRFLKSEPVEFEELNQTNVVAVGNRIAVFTSIVDSVALSFDLIYPFIVLSNLPQLRKLIKLCCRNEPKNDNVTRAVIPNIQVTDVAHAATAHHGAIEDHWNKVARVKFNKPPLINASMVPSTSGAKLESAQSNQNGKSTGSNHG